MIRPKYWLARRSLYNKTQMNPSENKSQSVYNPLEVMSAGEQNLMEIKRHPFGLVGLYIASIAAIVLILIGAALIPHYVDSLTSQDKTGLVAGAAIVIAIVLLYMYISVTIYKGNRWIVTSDSITQVSQVGLFRKQTSQLSLANLEDVTFEQTSFIQQMLGFGTLKVESAGERSKFSFAFCPKPDSCAKKIIAAHEAFIAARPEHAEQANRGNVDMQAFSGQSYPPVSPMPPISNGQASPDNDNDDGYSVPN